MATKKAGKRGKAISGERMAGKRKAGRIQAANITSSAFYHSASVDDYLEAFEQLSRDIASFEPIDYECPDGHKFRVLYSPSKPSRQPKCSCGRKATKVERRQKGVR